MYISIVTSDSLTHQQARNVSFYFLASYHTAEEILEMEAGTKPMTPMVADAIQAFKYELIFEFRNASNLLDEAEDRVNKFTYPTIQES